jgi:uncharacterized LabA/DUF88 family protein
MEIKDRVIIFIDGSNLYHILKNIKNKSKNKLTEFDFEGFVKHLAGDRKLIRTYYYTAPLDKKKDEKTYSKQQQFFEKLKKIPDFELVLCRMMKEKINGKEVYTVKEDDICLAIDMLKLAHKNAYDMAILVSSDGDFVPAIQAVKEEGKKIENVGFEKKFSWHLRQKCDRFRQLSHEEVEQFFSR